MRRLLAATGDKAWVICHKIVTLSIASKIVGGFALVLSIAIITALIASSTMSAISGSLDRLIASQAIAHTETNVERSLTRFRQHSSEFLRDGTDLSSAEAQQARRTLIELLKPFSGDGQNMKDAQRLRVLAGHFLSYSAAYNNAADLRRAVKTKLDNDVTQTAEQVRSALDGVLKLDGDPRLHSVANSARRLRQELIASTNFRDYTYIEASILDGESFFRRLVASLGHEDFSIPRIALERAWKQYTAALTDVSKPARDLITVIDATMKDQESIVSAAMNEVIQKRVELQAELTSIATSQAAAAIVFQKVAALLGLLVGLCLSYLISRSISKPIVELGSTMRSLASGGKIDAIPAATRRDEIGTMAKALLVFKQAIDEAERLRCESDTVAQKTAFRRKQELIDLASAFEQSIGGLVEGVARSADLLSNTAGKLSASARSTTDKAAAVSSESVRAASEVQSVACATEQLTASARVIGQDAQRAWQMTNDARQQVCRAEVQVSELDDATQRIHGMVDLINGLASQTNLLALNATIEAARAGEAGRGFSVVAQEVKSLALRSTDATEQIRRHIAAIESVAKDVAEVVVTFNGTVKKVGDLSTNIATAVQQQEAATQEIASTIGRVSEGASHVADSINSVSQGAKVASSGAVEVYGAADELANRAKELRSQVDVFLAGVRAA